MNTQPEKNGRNSSVPRRSLTALGVAGVALGGLLLASSLRAKAQTAPERTIWPDPMPRPIPVPRPMPMLNQELQLQSQRAQVEIKGAVAKTKLTQIFQNVTNRRIEGTYIFPLPEGAAISGFAMTVNGKRMDAEILEGDKARQIYTGIVQQMRDPAILEFIDRNLVQVKVFPIEPRAEQKMELEYTESLKADSNTFRYVVPLRLPTGGAARNASVDVSIQSPQGIRAVYSPTHSVEVKRDGNNARVTGEFGSNNVRPVNADDSIRRPSGEAGSDRDFVLYYTTATSRVGVNLITYRPGEEEGYFMLMVAPDSEIAQKEIAAKDVVFVFDTSGSMQGEKIDQARKALLSLLGNLNPDDRFNILTFSSDVRPFREGLTTVSKASIDAARDWVREIKAVGGTNINDALVDASKMMPRRLAGATRPQQIVFMTDGQPTVGETDIVQILKNVRAANSVTVAGKADERATLATNSPRLFAFGVGFDVNTRLLDTLAEDNRGASDYVLPNEDIEQKVGALYSKIAYPVLSNPRVDWGDMKVYDVYPKRLPDLFRGTQTMVFGRYEGRSAVRPQLIGMALGKEERIAGQGDFGGDGKFNDMLPRLWAMRKVGYLVDEARRSGRTVDVEVKDEIIKLSKKYGIVTPFTAGLITEDERQIPRPNGAPATPMLRDRNASVGGNVVPGPAGAPGTFSSRGAAGDSGAYDMAASPAPSSGAGGVAAAKASKKMREAERADDNDNDNVRYIDGKSFFLRNGVWTDGAYDPAKSPKLTKVKFASPEYFALLKDKQIAKWLSVGEKVLVVLKDKTVQVEP